MGFKPDLDEHRVSVVPEMTYNVLSGTLSNQPTSTIVFKVMSSQYTLSMNHVCY